MPLHIAKSLTINSESLTILIMDGNNGRDVGSGPLVGMRRATGYRSAKEFAASLGVQSATAGL